MHCNFSIRKMFYRITGEMHDAPTGFMMDSSKFVLETSCCQATRRRCHHSRLSIASLIWIHAGALRMCSRRRFVEWTRYTRWSNRFIKLTLDRNDQYICWQLHAEYPVSQKVPDIAVATVAAAVTAVAAAESTPHSTSFRLKFVRTSRSTISL